MVPRLIPLIGARIHVLNPSVRQLVLGWIVLLDSLPQATNILYRYIYIIMIEVDDKMHMQLI